jgi:phosphatidylinositol-4,5-bisphosphate 3-kinase
VSLVQAPFVLTPEFVFVMGGKESPQFERFVDYCCWAYNALRRYANIFITLFAMVLRHCVRA